MPAQQSRDTAFANGTSSYAAQAGVATDLTCCMAPKSNVAASLDPIVRTPFALSSQAFSDLVGFVKTGLLDERPSTSRTCAFVSNVLPSKAPSLTFESCK